MSEILEFYQEQAKATRLPGSWLEELQGQALQDFRRYGFPTRKNEEWKYTSLDAFLKQRFNSSLNASANALEQATPLIPLGQQLRICNGEILNLDEITPKLPARVMIKPLREAIKLHADKVKPYLAKLLKHEHGFQALNTALLQTGLFIYLPEGVCLAEPIVLAHWQDNEEQGIYPRHLIVGEAGSEATVIETFNGAENSHYLTTIMTEIYLAKRAKLIHYNIQNESKNAFHIGHLAVQQGQGSQFESHSISLGGKLVRSDLSVYLEEEQSKCIMNGLYLPKDNQHVDHHTIVHHHVPNCQSYQDYKGVLSGRSRAVFNGKVIVAKDAQHSEARQQNKNLLLSAQAEIDTKPQLDIFANDVICSHGATVGQLDEDALFYMATRGISRRDANRFLVQAFICENLNRLPHAQVKDWVATMISGQVE